MPTQTLTLRIEAALLPELEALVSKKGIPRSRYLQELVERHIQESQSNVPTASVAELPEEAMTLLRSVAQNSGLIKQLVAANARDQNREFKSIQLRQRKIRENILTLAAALIQKLWGASEKEALEWAHTNLSD